VTWPSPAGTLDASLETRVAGLTGDAAANDPASLDVDGGRHGDRHVVHSRRWGSSRESPHKAVRCVPSGTRVATRRHPVVGAQTEGFQTSTWWDPSPAVTGQPLTFGFMVFHPDPGAVVTSGQIVVMRRAWEGPILTRELVASSRSRG